MTQAVSDAIKDWEQDKGVSVDTLKRAKAGHWIKPTTAIKALKAIGKSDEEARVIAATIPASSEDDDKKSA